MANDLALDQSLKSC